MCFSATVSFSAAAVLALSGVPGLVYALKRNKKFIGLNVLLLCFAIQQFSEGMIWIGSPVFTAHFWGFLFLFFAFFVYPWLLSLSIYLLTEHPVLKRRIAVIAGFGFVFGLLLFLGELQVPNLGGDLCEAHIHYQTYFLGQQFLMQPMVDYVAYAGVLLYVFFVSAALFISDLRHSFWYGCSAVLLPLICFIIYTKYFVSVWCFYAIVFALVVTLSMYCSERACAR